MKVARISYLLAGNDPLSLETISHLEYDAGANRPTRVSITIDGEYIEKARWPKGYDTAELGSEITLSITPVGKTESVSLFKGFLIERRFQIEDSRPQMLLVAYCSAVKAGEGLLGNVNNQQTESNDNKLIEKILKDAGVSIKTGTPASLVCKQRILPPTSPWNFARHRAAANGLVLISGLDGVSVSAPSFDKAPLELTIGLSSIISLNLGEDATRLLAETEVSAWDIKTQELIKSPPAKATGGADKAAKKLGLKKLAYNQTAAVSKEECEADAKARILAARLAHRQGSVEIEGYFAAKVGDNIKIIKASTRFTDPYWISGFNLSVEKKSVRTTLTLGMEPERYWAPEVLPIPPLMFGKIADFKDDPDGLLRFQVKLSGLKNEALVWARLGTPLAGNKKGLYLPPKKDDEVVVGFIGDNWDCPVILASVHNPKQLPPISYAKEMPKFGLVLEEKGLQWLMDEKNKELTLSVADKKPAITLSAEKGLSIGDEKSTLVFDKGIAIKSTDEKGVHIEGKKIDIKSDSNVEIKVSGFVNIS
jgi:type VI secretion system secreted protein VgrG